MKLSKAQAAVMERAKEKIDYARTHDFLHWTAKYVMGRCLETDWDAHPNKYLTNKSVLENAEKAVKEDAENKVLPNFHRNGYEEAKNGIVITCCNTFHIFWHSFFIDYLCWK